MFSAPSPEHVTAFGHPTRTLMSFTFKTVPMTSLDGITVFFITLFVFMLFML